MWSQSVFPKKVDFMHLNVNAKFPKRHVFAFVFVTVFWLLNSCPLKIDWVKSGHCDLLPENVIKKVHHVSFLNIIRTDNVHFNHTKADMRKQMILDWIRKLCNFHERIVVFKEIFCGWRNRVSQRLYANIFWPQTISVTACVLGRWPWS